MSRSLHPAHYLKLWDIVDDTIITTEGCYFKGFRLGGLESLSAPGESLIQSADSLYADFKHEFGDHTLLQIVMHTHRDYSDIWRAYEADMPENPILAHQRRRRREYLEALALRRHDLYVFVGIAKPLTRTQFGRISASQHQRRVQETQELVHRVRAMLGRAGILCEALDRDCLLTLFHNGINPGSKETPIQEVSQGNALPLQGMRTLRERLFCTPMRWDDDYVQLGPRYCKVLTLADLPPHTDFTLMEAFGDIPMEFRLSVTVRFPSQSGFQSTFQRSRRWANATAHTNQNVEDHERLGQLQNANALSRELVETQQKLVLYGAQIVLSASTPHALEQKVRTFQECMRGKQLTFFEETLAHDREFFKTLPGMAVDFDRHRVVTTNNAVDLLPLFCPPRGDRKPALLLLTKNQELYSYDPVERVRDNWNAVVMGASGSGKSVFMNMLITCALGGSTRGRLMVVDFAGENKSSYLMVARLFGGQFVPVMSDKGLAINPFPPPRLALNPTGEVNEKVLSYLLVVTDSLLANEGEDKDAVLFRGILQRAIQDVYSGRGDDDAPLYSDLLATLEAYTRVDGVDRGRVQILTELLHAVLRGPGARLINRPTTVTVESPFVIFDLFGVEGLPRNVAQAITCIVSQYVRQVAFDDKDSSQKYIFLDEAAQQIRSPRMVTLFRELYDTARKHFTSVWTILQKYEDFVLSSLAKTVQTNSTSLILLNHARAESAREQIIADWDLSPREATLFRSLESKKGQFSELLLRTDVWDKHNTKRAVSAKLRLLLSPFDYQLATSDASDRKRQHKYIAANPHIPLHEVLDYVGMHSEGAA